jgi:hypothetical protein
MHIVTVRWVIYPLIVAFLFLKVITHYYFGMGIPGVEPSVNIPMIGGVIAFFSRLGLFFILNIFLFHSFIKNNDFLLKVFSSMAVVTYLLVDLSIGVKFSVIYEMIVLSYVVLLLLKKGTLNFKHIIVVFLGFLFVIHSFQYINYYRFALLHGYTGLSAIEFALSNNDANNLSFFHEMVNRITGVENFLITTLYTINNSASGIATLLTGEFASSFTESITGVSNSINAVGSTQIGAIYVVSGGNYLLFFVLSVTVLSLFSLGSLAIFKNLKTFLGNEGAVLGELFSIILFIYFLFGSGNYLFYIKEFIVVFISVSFTLNCFYKKRKTCLTVN